MFGSGCLLPEKMVRVDSAMSEAMRFVMLMWFFVWGGEVVYVCFGREVRVRVLFIFVR